MEVEFHNGKIYHFPDFPAHEHAALVSAASIGAHFNKQVRPKFTHHKVDQEQG